ncbi:MAG: hypothetical protein GYB65_09780 [Chloroflexi bacterium]|nr:hypothetical protein [Chloroflexota bacterium]
MDWFKQSQEMLKMWSDTQQKMWANWMDSMKEFSQPQGPGVWEKTLETWQSAVENMLETQAQWIRLWAGSLAASGSAPKEMVDGAIRLRDMSERWTKFQQELWSTWFEMVRTMDWFNQPQDQETPQPFQVWQDMFKKAMDSQMEWANSWIATFSEEPPGE